MGFHAESGIQPFRENQPTRPKITKVPGTGLEPAHLSILDPKSSASTNSAIPACGQDITGTRAGGKPAMRAGANLFGKLTGFPDSKRVPRHENTLPSGPDE